MNKRNAAAPGLGRKSRRRLGVDCERNSFFAFGPIDVGIGGRIDDRAPRLGRNHSRDRARILQIERGPTWRHNLNILGKGEGTKLLTDLAGSAKQEEAHRSRALLGEAAARVGVVRGQQRFPPGAILEVPFHGRVEAGFEGVSGDQPSSALSLPKSIA